MSMSMSVSMSVSVMGGWVNHEPWPARWECILGGIGGLLERGRGRGLGWGCGGDVDVDDQEEGCWWRNWRLKFSPVRIS